MNENIMSGKWNEFKGEVRKIWGKLTGDEVESTKGDMESLGGLVEQKYGLKKDEVARKLGELRDRFSEPAKKALRDDVGNEIGNEPH